MKKEDYICDIVKEAEELYRDIPSDGFTRLRMESKRFIPDPVRTIRLSNSTTPMACY